MLKSLQDGDPKKSDSVIHSESIMKQSAQQLLVGYLETKGIKQKSQAIKMHEILPTLGIERTTAIKAINTSNTIQKYVVREGRSNITYIYLGQNGNRNSKVHSEVTVKQENLKPKTFPKYDERIKKLEAKVRILQDLDHRGKQIKEPLFQDIIDEIKRERIPGFNLTGKKVNTKPYRIIFDKVITKIRELNGSEQ